MHGGGNTSLKGMVKTLPGDDVAALFVKASGIAMETITPADFVCLDLAYLRKLRALPSLSDETMANGNSGLHLLIPSDRLPSIETLMHAFIDRPAVVHTHPTAILTLTNRAEGEEAVAEALGDAVGVVPYVEAGLAFGRAVADELDRREGVPGDRRDAAWPDHLGSVSETGVRRYDRNGRQGGGVYRENAPAGLLRERAQRMGKPLAPGMEESHRCSGVCCRRHPAIRTSRTRK